MSELKRKREEEDEPGAADVASAEPSDVSSPPVPAALEEAGAPEAGVAAPSNELTAAPAAGGASAATARGEESEAAAAVAAGREATAASPLSSLPSPPPAERAPKQKKRAPPGPAAKILICGKEVLVKHTGGRKKRKHSLETLIVFAYKGQLALACKANNMVTALEIYREMKTKGIQQDVETHLMVLSLCGGSPGMKDELNPGNGSTARHDFALAKAAEVDAARGRVEGASAQEDTHAAAEAALQIFSDASKGGTVSLPESAYTAVIRACCLDARADRARETLEALKRADIRPRIRTYSPLLGAYSLLDGRLQDCMALWKEAASQPGIRITEREYLHLISACTRARDEKCFLEVMAEYMDDVLQPRSRESWDVLKAWFEVGPNVIGNGVSEEVNKPAAAAAAADGEDDPAEEGQVVSGSTSDLDAAAATTAAAGTEAATAAAAATPAASTATADADAAAADVAVADDAGDDTLTAADSGKEDACAPGKEPPPPSSSPPTAAAAAAAVASPDQEGGDKATGDGKDAPSGDRSGDDDDPMGASREPPSDDRDGDAPPVTANSESPSGGDLGDDVTAAGDSGGGGWTVAESKVRSDGTCENCGEVLRSIDLPQDDEQRLLKQIEDLVCTNAERTKQWEGFRGWLERRGKNRYDVIIDGANVGYYKQAADSQEELADLRQVDWAVKKYEELGKKPLVVLHSRHLVAKWLSDEATEIYKRWKEKGIIQSCAPKNNDDWYWLYCAVYIGGSVLVLTNDEMRDHHFSMLSHRSFQRWKERHQTRFSFGDWNEEGERRELIPEEPRSYSKRTQKGFNSWHVPLEHSGDWLCARWRR